MIFEGYLYQEDPKMDRVPVEEQVFWFACLTALVSVMILWFNQDLWQLEILEYIFKPITILAIIFFGISKFFGYSKKDPINGSIHGIIRITLESIEIDKTFYRVDEVKNLNIVVKNYSGELLLYRVNMYGAKRSNGTKNYISFNYNGDTIKKNFLIQSEQDLEKLKEIKTILKKTSTKKLHK